MAPLLQRNSLGWRFAGFLPVVILAAGVTFSARAYAMDKIKVALAQSRCVDSDLEGNFKRIGEMVRQAKEAGAQMVFFPECADLGWVNPEARKLAGPIPGPISDRVCRLASENGLWIGIGLCEKDGDKLYDSAILVDPGGKIVLKHHKINLLAWLMDPPYAPGNINEIKAADTPLGRMGMLICADSFEEPLVAAVHALKPDLVYIPYGWAAPREKWPEHSFTLVQRVQATAKKIGAPVVGPNVVGEITHGPWTGQTYEGLSTAADGAGLSLVQGRWNKEDLIILEIQPGYVGGNN